jgi:hypothetical protein
VCQIVAGHTLVNRVRNTLEHQKESCPHHVPRAWIEIGIIGTRAVRI